MRNAKLYRLMSEPLKSADAVNATVNAFNAELRALREKHRIRDLCCIVSGGYVGEDGEELDYMLDMSHGDIGKMEMLLAYGLGRASADRQSRIGTAIRGRAVISQAGQK